IGGKGDMAYGPRVRGTYGATLEICRGPTITKHGVVPTLKQLVSGNLSGAQPGNFVAEEMAAADIKTLRLVTLLSVLNNLTVAITQMVMHFKFPDYHRPRPENPPAGKKEKPDAYDQMEWDGTPRILDTVVTELPRRLMAMIAIIEQAGGYENTWQAFK